MTAPRHPAAYICVTPKSGAGALAMRQHAIAEATRQRGWQAPSVYADEDDPSIGGGCSPAMATLAAAISAGRHDALIISGLNAISGGPAYLLTRLLFPLTHTPSAGARAGSGVDAERGPVVQQGWVEPGSSFVAT